MIFDFEMNDIKNQIEKKEKYLCIHRKDLELLKKIEIHDFKNLYPLFKTTFFEEPEKIQQNDKYVLKVFVASITSERKSFELDLGRKNYQTEVVLVDIQKKEKFQRIPEKIIYERESLQIPKRLKFEKKNKHENFKQNKLSERNQHVKRNFGTVVKGRDNWKTY